MKNTIICLQLLFFIPLYSYSQHTHTRADSSKAINYHSFTFCTGLSNQISRDDMISPNIYSGWHVPAILNYNYQRKKAIHSLSVSIIRTKLTSAVPDLPNGLYHYTSNSYFSLDYSYSLKVCTIPEMNIQCFLGGKYVSFLNFRNHYYFESKSEFYFEQINSLGLNFILNKKFLAKNDFLCFQIHTPFIAYSLYNNIYNSKSYLDQTIDINKSKIDLGKIFKNGEFITINKFFELQTQISYTKFVSQKIACSLVYGFDYYSIAQYKQLLRSKYLMSRFLLGFTVKI